MNKHLFFAFVFSLVGFLLHSEEGSFSTKQLHVLFIMLFSMSFV